ncbi:HTH-type transcriptional activator CmpR [Aquimixticola soesokkakensis]|uniref:HTH-type transcriptional activator CmpR n=1 Tax=Aquimixticola soesokkakensis TaxID=1519096 RepID=A0A1Y5STI9_9RHOB|nr:LysR family transcriptional regulator [Aquimixticola soesokkakensis]SLN48160.1 HTH-type transcriptional activator CmpR [Aquimixticola soesokkakensis]
MKELTLRQIEVLRAVMLAGTIKGAADLLNVSSPGISRLIRHLEDSLGLRLFERKAGLFVPAEEARAIFEMVHQVYRQVENLNESVAALRKGEDVGVAFACAPSIAQFIAARSIRGIRTRFPDLAIDLNILKIEEMVDYLLLEKGEFVVMSSLTNNAALESAELAVGRVVAIMPDDHPLAAQPVVSVQDLVNYPIVGVDPKDPYGRILAAPFTNAGLDVPYSMRGRFAQSVVSLVRHGLGVALIDEFSVAEVYMPGVARRALVEGGEITAYVVTKKGRQMSSFAEFAIEQFRRELTKATERTAWDDAPTSRSKSGGQIESSS